MVAWAVFSAASRCAGLSASPSARMISMSPMPRKAKIARRYFSWKSFALERHSRCVKTAARRGDDHVLASGQADRPVRRVAEGFAGDRDAVDPCLELAWDAKVIHRCADDEDVGGEELVEHVAATLVYNPDRAFRRIR